MNALDLLEFLVRQQGIGDIDPLTAIFDHVFRNGDCSFQFPLRDAALEFAPDQIAAYHSRICAVLRPAIDEYLAASGDHQLPFAGVAFLNRWHDRITKKNFMCLRLARDLIQHKSQ